MGAPLRRRSPGDSVRGTCHVFLFPMICLGFYGAVPRKLYVREKSASPGSKSAVPGDTGYVTICKSRVKSAVPGRYVTYVEGHNENIADILVICFNLDGWWKTLPRTLYSTPYQRSESKSLPTPVSCLRGAVWRVALLTSWPCSIVEWINVAIRVQWGCHGHHGLPRPIRQFFSPCWVPTWRLRSTGKAPVLTYVLRTPYLLARPVCRALQTQNY